MAHSLRRRFGLVMGLGSMLTWILLAVWLLWHIQREVNALFDAHIAEASKTLAELVQSESLEYTAENKSNATTFKRFVADELRVHLGMPSYARNLAYQISYGNPPSEMRSPNAPAPLVAPHGGGFSDQTIDTQRWRSFTLIMNGGTGPIVVTIGEPRAIRAQVVHRLALGVGVPVLGSLALLLWVLWSGISWGLRPLAGLATEVTRRSPEDLHPLTMDDVPEEVKPLTTALNHLLARLATALQAEREFTANAAHELRTPLAGIKTQAEVALAARDEQERANALKQIVLGIDRTTGLVEKLLSLARLDPGLAHDEIGAVVVSDIVRRVFMDFAAVATQQAVSLRNELGPEIIVLANAETLHIALRNLIDNALKHGASPGTVRILARPTETANIDIVIEDDGRGVPSAMRARLQQRFTRLPGTHAAGSGLGLAIVARIADLHHATLEFDNAELGGLRVILRWPLAASPHV